MMADNDLHTTLEPCVYLALVAFAKADEFDMASIPMSDRGSGGTAAWARQKWSRLAKRVASALQALPEAKPLRVPYNTDQSASLDYLATRVLQNEGCLVPARLEECSGASTRQTQAFLRA
jgi:hypothetical protein